MSDVPPSWFPLARLRCHSLVESFRSYIPQFLAAQQGEKCIWMHMGSLSDIADGWPKQDALQKTPLEASSLLPCWPRVGPFVDAMDPKNEMIVVVMMFEQIAMQGRDWLTCAKFTLADTLPLPKHARLYAAPGSSMLEQTAEAKKAKQDAMKGLCYCQLPSCSKVEAIAYQFQKCGQCRLAPYCSKACQKQDWSRHKEECVPKTASQKPAPKK